MPILTETLGIIGIVNMKPVSVTLTGLLAPSILHHPFRMMKQLLRFGGYDESATNGGSNVNDFAVIRSAPHRLGGSKASRSLTREAHMHLYSLVVHQRPHRVD